MHQEDQAGDVDPQETQEWLESIDAVLQAHGPHRAHFLLERLIGGDQADVVLFGDMGKAWLSGQGPGRVPNSRLPALHEWAYDSGVGLDFDGLAAYVATPLQGPFAPRLTLRLQRRF